jgi:hypothetical protein
MNALVFHSYCAYGETETQRNKIIFSKQTHLVDGRVKNEALIQTQRSAF